MAHDEKTHVFLRREERDGRTLVSCVLGEDAQVSFSFERLGNLRKAAEMLLAGVEECELSGPAETLLPEREPSTLHTLLGELQVLTLNEREYVSQRLVEWRELDRRRGEIDSPAGRTPRLRPYNHVSQAVENVRTGEPRREVLSPGQEGLTRRGR